MRARATAALDAALARGCSEAVSRDAYAREVALIPIRADLRRLGLSRETAEDALARLADMPEADVVAALRLLRGGADTSCKPILPPAGV